METGRPGRPDAELVAAVVDGDVPAFAELYDRHAHAVYRAAFRRLGDRQQAEEVLQDAYLALWNRAELFDAGQGSVVAWLSTIARNRAVDRLRALGRRPAPVPLSAVVPLEERDEGSLERTIADAEPVASGNRSIDPVDVVVASGVRDEVLAALETMPGNEREVIELAYYDELTQSEIASRLGWPLGTVKTRTRRALARLRTMLAERLDADVAPRGPQAVAVDRAAPDEGPPGQRRAADG